MLHFGDNEGVLQFFDRYREYVKHQYELIQHRTNWFILIQSLLFTTFGFTIQKKVEVIGRDLKEHSCTEAVRLCANLAYTDLFMIVLCFVGVGTSVATWLGLSAARKPISLLFERWIQIRDSITADLSRSFVPYSTGGFLEWPAQRGPRIAMSVPIILGAAWVLILAILILPSVKQVGFLGYTF